MEPNHILYANRANVHLELEDYLACIKDCDQAIALDPSFSKSYYRKAKAQLESSDYQEALKTLHLGNQIDPSNDTILELIAQINSELASDPVQPLDHPELQKLDAFLSWFG